jgi:hypothetical protein
VALFGSPYHTRGLKAKARRKSEQTQSGPINLRAKG